MDLNQIESKPAIAKLEWKESEYYMRRKRVTIGRHSSRGNVDVDLGHSNYISRNHLELFFEDRDFYLKCNGKNGVFVDTGFLKPENRPMKLPSRCVIKFPSADLSVDFYSLLEDAGSRWLSRSVPELAAGLVPASPTLSPAATISAGNSRPASPRPRPATEPDTSADDGRLWPAAEAGVPQPPLLHHSYSSGPAATAAAADQRLSAANRAAIVLPSKDKAKPPFSYAQLIVQAVSTAREKQLSLSGVYAFITKNYPYYRTADKGWQNSIRHNLSLNRYFVKVPRSQQDPGKGCFWRIDTVSEPLLVERAFRRRRQRPLTGAVVRPYRANAQAAELSPDSPQMFLSPGGTPDPGSRETSPPLLAPASGSGSAATPAATDSGDGATFAVPNGASDGSRLVPMSEDCDMSSLVSAADVIFAQSDDLMVSSSEDVVDMTGVYFDTPEIPHSVTIATAPAGAAGDGPC